MDKSAHGYNWKSRKIKKQNKASRTSGSQKVLTCRHKAPKKYLATRSRSYKHPEFQNWHKIFEKR